MCSTRQGHIEAVVDDDSRTTSARDHQDVRAQTRQLAGFKIAFANLQNIDAGFDRMTRLQHQAFAGALPGHFPGKTATVRDEMQNQDASPVGSIAETRVVAAVEEDRGELGKAGEEIDEAQSADGSADEIIAQDRAESGPCVGEVVFFPRS